MTAAFASEAPPEAQPLETALGALGACEQASAYTVTYYSL